MRSSVFDEKQDAVVLVSFSSSLLNVIDPKPVSVTMMQLCLYASLCDAAGEDGIIKVS